MPQDASIRVGIVLPIYQRRFVKQTIRLIFETNQRPDMAICVVNDGNRKIESYVDHIALSNSVNVLHLTRNVGFAGANNAGWKYLIATYPNIKYLGTINDDTIPRRKWLDFLINALENYRAALSMPVMEQYERNGLFRHKRNYAAWRITRAGGMEPSKYDIDKDCYTAAVNGFCFLTEKAALDKINFFDDRFANGCEDLDLGIRLLISGYKMVVAKDSKVFHYGARSRYSPGVNTDLDFNHRLLLKKWGDNMDKYNNLDKNGNLVSDLQSPIAKDEPVRKRFAAHVLMFNCDQFILRMIDNCGPYVDKIYVAYSEYPWTYNPKAREEYKNTSDKNILKASPYYSKIDLIEGVWETDEDQRNACLKKAKKDGIDYLIIQDADEYYHSDDYKSNINAIIDNPDWDYYVTPWCSFWKNLDYIVLNDKGSDIVGYPEFAINCHRNVFFASKRVLNSKDYFMLKGKCYHLSYVFQNKDLLRKIGTWGHSNDFDRDKWYRNKWLKWNESTRNLHPVEPSAWKRAVRFSGELPESLDGFSAPEVKMYVPTLMDKVESIKDYSEEAIEYSKTKILGLVTTALRRWIKH